jgi:competence protein ComEC
MLVEPWSFVRMKGDGRLHVTFLDVGQGDAALVTFPRGASMLIDAGGLAGGASFDIGDRVVAPVLRHRGVRRLAVGALSHADADHVGGFPSMVVEFRPPELWEGIPVPAAATRQAVHRAAGEVGSWWRNVRAEDRLTVDEVSIVVKHPGLADWERQDVRNDDSVVLELRWRGVSVVFTGDIGAATEHRLLGSFEPALLRVVKVPHHGSLTSSSGPFVRALAPRAAVVSVGRGNRFGHPAPEVLRRYAAAGATVFRTDIDGAVQLDTDGRSIELATFTGRRARLTVPGDSKQEGTD